MGVEQKVFDLNCQNNSSAASREPVLLLTDSVLATLLGKELFGACRLG
jgi:hypothetical protein